MYTIYKVTHKPTGKEYIGQTKHSSEYRFIQHFSKAVLEHDPVGKLEELMTTSKVFDFDLEDIETNIKTRKEALVKENEYIHKYDIVKNGLNNNYGSIKYNEGKTNRMYKDYMSGDSLPVIANNFNCTVPTVRNILYDRFDMENVFINGLQSPPWNIVLAPTLIPPPWSINV